MNERSTLLTNEPNRKLCNLDAVERNRSVIVSRGGQAERAADAQFYTKRLQPIHDRVTEARLVDEALIPELVVPPVVEPADQHRVVEQVDHGTWTERHDRLAQSHF